MKVIFNVIDFIFSLIFHIYFLLISVAVIPVIFFNKSLNF